MLAARPTHRKPKRVLVRPGLLLRRLHTSAQSACCRWPMLSLFCILAKKRVNWVVPSRRAAGGSCYLSLSFLYFGQEACELGNVASSQNPRRFVGSQAVRHFPSLHSRILSRVSHSMISPEGAPRLASHSPGTRLLLCSPQCKLACKPHIKHACAQVDPHCPFTKSTGSDNNQVQPGLPKSGEV